jgi:short-subunit dehydrogenase
MSHTAAFLPRLLAQPSARIVNVTSGLAYVPYAMMPVYCATKAALRSVTLSLRHHIRATSVRVIELLPPAVSTELHDYMGPKGREIGIPLEEFVREAMEALNSGSEEIHVANAKKPFRQPRGIVCAPEWMSALIRACHACMACRCRATILWISRCGCISLYWPAILETSSAGFSGRMRLVAGL